MTRLSVLCALALLAGFSTASAGDLFSPVPPVAGAARPAAVTQPCAPGKVQIWCGSRICVTAGETCCAAGTLRFVCPVGAPCDRKANPPTCRPRSS